MSSQIPENSTPACDQLRSAYAQYSWTFGANQSGNTCQRRVAGVKMSAGGPGHRTRHQLLTV